MRQSVKETLVLCSQNLLQEHDYHEAMSNALLYEAAGYAATFQMHAEQAKLLPKKTIH